MVKIEDLLLSSPQKECYFWASMDDEFFLPKKCPNGLAKIKPLAVKPQCHVRLHGGVFPIIAKV
jgi:hypothetical protein